MPNYSLAVTTTGTAAATAAWEIRTSANRRAYILELGLFLTAATASTYGVGTPAAIGVGPTTPVNFLPDDPANVIITGDLQSALAWTTGPTVPAAFNRLIGLPATIGSGVIFTWPKGLIIAVSSSRVLWNSALNSAVQAYAECEA